MSLNPTSLVNTPATSPSAYVPLSKREKQKIEAPQDPQAELQLVQDLYEQASVTTLEEKAKAPYTKDVNRYGEITLKPNRYVEGATYRVNEDGQVWVTPPEYKLPGTLNSHEENAPPELLSELAQVMAEAQVVPEQGTLAFLDREHKGQVEISKTNADGSHVSYFINPDGSVDAFNSHEDKLGNFVYSGSQQLVKPGELPVLKDGEERPVGHALNEATCPLDAEAPANGKILNLEA